MYCTNFLYKFGKELPGFYSYYYELFQRLHDSGVKLSVITHINYSKEREGDNSISVYEVGRYRRKFQKNPLRWPINAITGYSNTRVMAKMALRVHEKDPIDIISAYHSVGCGLAALRVKVKAKIPIIFNPITGLRHVFLRPPQLRNYPHLKNFLKKSDFLNESFTRFYNNFEKRYFQAYPKIFKQSDLIIVPSVASMKDALYFGADPKKIVIVPFAVDLSEFSPKAISHENLERLKRRNSPLLLFVGRLSITEKAVDDVLKAFKLIRKTFPDAGLVIVGDGPEKNALMHLSHLLGLTDSVFFLGSKKHSEISNIISTADILLLPFKLDQQGLTADTFGRVIIEGLACGKVVATTDAEPFNEIIENNKDGLLIQPNDYRGIANVTCKVLSDESHKKEIEKNARKKAEKQYSFPIVANRIINIYKNLIHS